MDRRHFIAGFLGAAAGALAIIGVSVVLSDDGPPVAGTTVTTVAESTTTTTTLPVWVADGEARIGPSVVVPTTLSRAGSDLILSYEVVSITPLGDHEGEDHPASSPASWTITTSDGTLSTRALSPFDGSVRFNTSAGAGDVESARIDSYWVAAPLDTELVAGRDDASWHEIVPGLRLRVLQVIEQADNFLVIVEGGGEAPTFQQIAVEGSGRAWVSSSRSMLGTNRWTLDFRGEVLPDPLELTVRGLTWIELPAELPVALDGVDRL